MLLHQPVTLHARISVVYIRGSCLGRGPITPHLTTDFCLRNIIFCLQNVIYMLLHLYLLQSQLDFWWQNKSMVVQLLANSRNIAIIKIILHIHDQ